MAYVKLGTFAVFLLTAFLIFPMKNAGQVCPVVGRVCSPFEMPQCGNTIDCRCVPWGLFVGSCISPTSGSSGRILEMIEEHPNLCKTHVDCIKKGSGSFCSHYGNRDIEHGWCFVSNIEAQRFLEIGSNSAVRDFFKITSNSKLDKDYLKMALEIATNE